MKLNYDEPISNDNFKFNLRGYTKVAVALLDGGADIDFVPGPMATLSGFTPLIYATFGNRAGVVRMLLKRSADGTKGITQPIVDLDPGSTALDLARNFVNSGRAEFAQTLAVLRLRCCSACGVGAYTRPLFCST